MHSPNSDLKGKGREIIYRAIHPSDEPQVQQLVTMILSKEFPADSSAYDAEDLNRLKETYASPSNAFFVAEKEHRVIGTCGVKSDGPHTAILRRLFVDPGCRRQGIGAGLLKKALEFCRDSRFHEVVIRTSNRMEQAIRLCESFGFKENGRWTMGQITLIRLTLRLA